MDGISTIRPLVICLFRHDRRVLAFVEYDRVKDEIFYRPLGGGIKYGERSRDALVREIKEELDTEICNINYLCPIENIFVFEGTLGHEIVIIYDGEFVDKTMYGNDLKGFEKDGERGQFTAKWLDIDDLRKDGSPPIYPEGILDIIDGEKSN